MTTLDNILNWHYMASKGPSSQSYGFSSSHVWMWELDRKESWVPKNWCFWTVVLEKTLESPLDCKEIQPVHPKGNQSWIFIARTDVETAIFWPPDAKSWLIGKDPDSGKDWRQEEKGMTEDKVVGWHHRLDGHEFEQALGVGEGQGSLAYCSPWGHKESDTTERLNSLVIFSIHFLIWVYLLAWFLSSFMLPIFIHFFSFLFVSVWVSLGVLICGMFVSNICLGVLSVHSFIVCVLFWLPFLFFPLFLFFFFSSVLCSSRSLGATVQH